jgi:hypothetical protein
MNKKTMIVYTFLFLFVFTFALSFSLASKAQAVPGCCVLDWCYCNGQWTVSAMGHEKFIIGQGTVCVYEGWPVCDWIDECCD